MAVRIRLRRMGRKKQPHYRIVVAEGEFPRDGRIVENLGYYKPLSDPARLVVDMERADFWISKGAEPSGTVKSLLGKARRGGDETVAVGVEDVEARRQAEAEELQARRAAEKKAKEEEAAAAKAAKAEAAEKAAAAEGQQVPQDVEGGEAAGSATDETKAEATATSEEEAVAAAEDAEPQAPAEESAKKASAGKKKGADKEAAAAAAADETAVADKPAASDAAEGASGEEEVEAGGTEADVAPAPKKRAKKAEAEAEEG